MINTSEEQVDQHVQQFIRPFDLQRDALSRSLLIETPTSLYFLSDTHHIILDGSSDSLLTSYIGMAYDGQTLPKEQVSLHEYAQQEELSIETPAYRQAETYYKEKFAGAEMTKLLQKSNNEGYVTKRSAFVSRELVADFYAQHEVKPSWLFMAAFGITLSRFSRTETVAYATINHGRHDKRLLDSFGMFVKTVPILMRIDETQPAVDFIKSHKQELASTREYGNYPFTHFCQHLGVKPELTFGFQGSGVKEECQFSDGYIKFDQPLAPVFSKENPAVMIYETDTEYEVRMRYVDDQYESSYMQQFVNSMATCVERLTASPDKILKNIAVLSDVEQQKLIALGKGEELVYDRSETFIDLFHKQVALHPDSTAVVDEVSSITYAELDRQSDLMAHALIKDGVGSDKFVAVMLPRRKEFLLSVLAVFKAGGAYIPLDSDYPNDRLLYMLEDSQAKVLITNKKLLDEKRKDGDFRAENILFVDEFDFSGTCSSINNSRHDSLAYMIYTSGSTGKPKGVMMEHKGLRNFVEWRNHFLAIQHTEAIAQHASFSFDASLDDLITPLSVGGEVHIISSSLRQDMDGLYNYFKQHSICGGTLSTQLGMEVMNQYDLPLRYIMMGGEKLKPTRPSSVKVVNGYGPTEFTVCSSYHIVEQGREYDNIPIGRPVPNTISAIVDVAGNLVPRGVDGELCLIGRQTARGYWNRPELTAEKFIDCPFIEGEKMYRTGDLARWNEDGELEYLGRIDTQVKLRGFRIELGEIESAISKYDGIQSAVVEVKEIGSVQHLCGYYTSLEAIDEEKLRNYLSETLTDYMVPTAFVRMDSMPLTPNGKVNRKALPMPEIKAEEIVAPATGKEEILFDIVKSLLSREDFGVSTNLIRMGLTSLSAIKLVAKANKKGLKLKLNDILKYKTIREILSQEMSLGFWTNDYQPDKPIVVLIHGLTNHIQLKPLTTKLIETYSVFVVEPLEEHYHYIFHGEDKAEVINMYTALLDLLLPKDSTVHAFIGHSYGGELVYRSAAQWHEMTAQQAEVILFDTFVGVDEQKMASPNTELLKSLPMEVAEEIAARMRQSEILSDLADGKPLPSYEGSVMLFKALRQEQTIDIDVKGFIRHFDNNEQLWRTVVPQINVVAVDADHYGMMAEEHMDLYKTHGCFKN